MNDKIFLSQYPRNIYSFVEDLWSTRIGWLQLLIAVLGNCRFLPLYTNFYTPRGLEGREWGSKLTFIFKKEKKNLGGEGYFFRVLWGWRYPPQKIVINFPGPINGFNIKDSYKCQAVWEILSFRQTDRHHVTFFKKWVYVS